MMPSEKVLLINPPLYRDPIWDPIRVSQPLGLWSIGTCLLKHGHNVKVLCTEMRALDNQTVHDSNGNELSSSSTQYYATKVRDFERSSPEQFHAQYFGKARTYLRTGMDDDDIIQFVNAFSPRVIGISSCFTCNHKGVVDLAVRLRREVGSDCLIVVGGQHATAWPETLFRDSQGAIDFIVRGEGERSFLEVVEHCHDRDTIKSVPLVCYWENGHVISSTDTRKSYYTGVGFIELDQFFDFEPALLENEGYDLPHHTYTSQGRKFTDIMFSVGCHKSCPFCFANHMRGGLRVLSKSKIVDMLTRLRAAGYEELVLQDDDLLTNLDYFKSLLDMISATGFKWQDNGGLEFEALDEDRVDAILASGCTSLYIPFNPRRIKDRVPVAPDQHRLDLVRRMRDAGIYVYTSGIYGVPDLQCPEHFLEDMEHLCELNVSLVERGVFDASLVFPLSILPGTLWWKKLTTPGTEHGFAFEKENWLEYSIYVPQLHPKALDRSRFEIKLLEIYKRLNSVQKSYPWFSPFPNAEHGATPTDKILVARQEVSV